jgi:hypothetical protein
LNFIITLLKKTKLPLDRRLSKNGKKSKLLENVDKEILERRSKMEVIIEKKRHPERRKRNTSKKRTKRLK